MWQPRNETQIHHVGAIEQWCMERSGNTMQYLYIIVHCNVRQMAEVCSGHLSYIIWQIMTIWHELTIADLGGELYIMEY